MKLGRQAIGSQRSGKGGGAEDVGRESDGHENDEIDRGTNLRHAIAGYETISEVASV